MVQRLAIGHPAVAFTLKIDGKTTIDVPAHQALPDRVRVLFGNDMAESLLPVSAHTDVCELTGYVAHPSLARPTAKRQFVYLNGRHIRDKIMIAALREGYHGFMEPRLHPSVFLTLDCDPQLVDVNVHPTKAEVRFRREREVFGLVKKGLQTTLTEHVGGFTLLNNQDRPQGTAASAAPITTSPASADIVSRTVVKPPSQHFRSVFCRVLVW